MLQRAGVNNVIATARQLGITSDLAHDASLALGTSEVSLIELTAAYAPFASGGIGAWPLGIVEIRDAPWRRDLSPRRLGAGPGDRSRDRRHHEPAAERRHRLWHRQGGAWLDRPAAGKTGTTQDSRDALFVGYTADLVCGVWFGNDDDSPMKNVTGGTLPAHAWHDFMTAATRGMPVTRRCRAPRRRRPSRRSRPPSAGSSTACSACSARPLRPSRLAARRIRLRARRRCADFPGFRPAPPGLDQRHADLVAAGYSWSLPAHCGKCG